MEQYDMSLYKYKTEKSDKIDSESLNIIVRVLVEFWSSLGRTRVHHCDIKPSNILLNTKWVFQAD